MNTSRTRLVAVVLAGLVLAATSCSASGSESQGSGSKDPIKIASILPISGPAAAFGVLQEHGVEIAVAEINAAGGVNGRTIELTKLDDQSAAQQAVAQTKKAISDGVDAIVGSGLTATCYAMLPLVNQSETLSYCLSGAPVPDEDKFMLFALPDTDAFIASVGAWMNDHNYTKLGILAGSDASGKVISGILAKNLPAQGITISGTETFDPTASDVTAQLTKLRADKPDVLYSVTTGDGPTATVLRGMSGLSFDVPVITGWNNAQANFRETISKVLPPAGLYVPGLTIYTTPAGGGSALGEFVAKYQKKYPDASAEMYSASAYDAVSILARAVANGGTGQKGLDYVVNGLGPYDGATGTIQFGAGKLRGTSSDSVILMKVTPTAFVKAD